MKLLTHLFTAALALAIATQASAQGPYPLQGTLFPDPTVLQGLGQQGRCVAVDAGYLVVGAPLADLAGEPQNSGAVFVYDATTGALLATLTNPTPASDDQFGFAVAVSGSRVVVGAYQDDTGATDSGSAYVYDLASATPTTPITLPNPTPAASDNFGYDVAVSGALVVVGAYLDDTGGSNAGSVYVYDMGSATPTVPLTVNNPAPSGKPSDFFGESVAVSGNRVAVGAYGTDAPGAGYASGAAYLFDYASATPTVPVATVRNPLPPSIDYFGGSVAASGNLLVVGADHDDRGATDSGVAYVYDLESATPATPLAVLINPSPAASDAFGYSVAVSGSIVIVGADLDDAGATDSGAAYVYDLAGATPTVPILTLNNPSPASSDNFGAGVAVAGNIMVVGAYQDDTGATNAGSAYVYDLTSATPTVPVFVLNNPSPAANDQFGWAVAVSGNRVVVGANQDDTGATDAGTAYVYDLSSATPTVPVATLTNPTPAAFDRFAYAVAISGNRVAVGAPLDDTGASDAGSAYVYDLASATPTVPVATLNNPSPAATEYFGGVVAISGSRVVAGSYSDDTGGSDAGSAFVYDLASATPTVPVTLGNPAPAASDYFGWSVAITASRVIVGAPLDDTLNSDEGAVYVFGAPLGPPVPEIAVEQPAGTPLADGAGSVSFGIVAFGGNSARTFTIKNTGNANLTGLGIVIDGPDAADFAVTASPTAPVPGPSGSTIFTITFTPGSAGAKTAALHLASNDTDENPFDIALTGTGLTELESWRQFYFGTTADTGNAADTADPDGDGDTNLFEYIAGLVPTSALSRFIVRAEDVAGQPAQKAIIFSPLVAGRTYAVTSKASLTDPTWTPLGSFSTSDDGPNVP